MRAKICKRTATPAATDDAPAELARLSALSIDDLRLAWRGAMRRDPPAAFGRDLLTRSLMQRWQEERCGGLDAATRRALADHAGGKVPVRRLKPGSRLVREHDGRLHEAIVLADGYAWEARRYPSLSAIAKAITGVNWSGPRFFGLRDKAGRGGVTEPGQPSQDNAPPVARNRRPRPPADEDEVVVDNEMAEDQR